MAKAKPETVLTQLPVSTGAATGPVSEITIAADGVHPDKGLHATEGGAPGNAGGGDLLINDGAAVTSAVDVAESGPVLTATEGGALADAGGGNTSINDAAFDDAMKRFASQGKTVVVKGPEKGRWRAGRHFTIEPTSIPLADLTEADLEKLCGDSLLTVGIIDAPY